MRAWPRRVPGVRLGRPPALTAEQIRYARDLLARPENTVSSVARLLGVSRSTIYKYVPEIAHAGLPADTRPLPGVAAYDQLLPARHANPGLPAAIWTQHQSRPGRSVLIAASLADLRGPTRRTIELPLRLFWSGPDHKFDLRKPGWRPPRTRSRPRCTPQATGPSGTTRPPGCAARRAIGLLSSPRTRPREGDVRGHFAELRCSP